MNKAFVYARKSSEDAEKQIQSIDDQLTEMRLLQEKVGIPVFDTFTDTKTAKESGVRTNFTQMIRRIQNGEVDTVYTWKADRLSRNGTEGGQLIELVDKGILKQIITPHQTYTRENSMMLWVEFMSSTNYSKVLSDNVKRSLVRKAERGEYPGQAQVGYLNTPKRLKGERTILVDKKKWDLMRKWFDLMLTGNYTVESSLEIVTKMGLKGKTGKPISRSAAFAIMRNIFYTGNFEYGGIVYPGNHTPMLSMSEWVKIQNILNKKGKKGGTTLQAPDEKTFQGMLTCGECGAGVTVSKVDKKYKNGTTQRFWYYHCTKRLGPCSQGHLRAELFEPQLKEYISSLELNPKFGDWVKKVLKRRNTQEFALERKQQELKTKKLSEITDRKEKLYGMKIEGLYSEEDYQKKKKDLLVEESQLRESLKKPATSYWESVIDNTVNFASSVMKLFEEGDIFTRQMVLRILGSNFILKDKKVVIQAKYAFVFLKELQNETYSENLWLEPKTDGILDQNKISKKSVLYCAEDRT